MPARSIRWPPACCRSRSGEATKTVPWLMEAEKTYLFTIRWGVSTDTQDREGKSIAESDVRPTPDAIRAALPSFIGEIEQVPPQFSAVKVDGERAYDLARAGEDGGTGAARGRRSTRPSSPRPRARTSPPSASAAEKASISGPWSAIWRPSWARRAMSGGCAAPPSAHSARADAVTLDALEDLRHKGAASERLKPVETALDDIPALAINGEDAFKLRQGRPIVLLPHVVEALKPKFRDRTIAGQDASRAALALFQGKAVALGDVRAGQFKPTRVFHLADE